MRAVAARTGQRQRGGRHRLVPGVCGGVAGLASARGTRAEMTGISMLIALRFHRINLTNPTYAARFRCRRIHRPTVGALPGTAIRASMGMRRLPTWALPILDLFTRLILDRRSWSCLSLTYREQPLNQYA